jgi:hypothetical protein
MGQGLLAINAKAWMVFPNLVQSGILRIEFFGIWGCHYHDRLFAITRPFLYS